MKDTYTHTYTCRPDLHPLCFLSRRELRRATGQLLDLDSESDVIELCTDKLALKTARLLSDRINSRKQGTAAAAGLARRGVGAVSLAPIVCVCVCEQRRKMCWRRACSA